MKMIDSEDGFEAQQCRLEELAEKYGQHAIFLPKFHCELNFIEMVWGAAKRYARLHCEYTMKALQTKIPEALDSVSVVMMRKFARKAERFIDAYRQGQSDNVTVCYNAIEHV